MRCFIVFYGAGTILVLSTYKSATDPRVARRLQGSNITKMILMEVPLDLVRERYGEHFEEISRMVGSEAFKVLDFNGASVLNRFTFAEMGPPIMVEF